MKTESAKAKKNEILNLLKNYSKLRAEKEFNAIKYNLHEVCKDGDLDLIKIYLCVTVENHSKTFKFKIDETNQTASLFRVNEDIEEVIVPRTVEHESVEYLITSISGTSHNLKTLKFAEDSAVKTIYGYAFPYMSEIKNIYFPSSLKELKKGWCFNTDNLFNITISPLNNLFMLKKDKYLFGRSDNSNYEFDIILFARRDIKKISIPSNVKIVSSYAFHFCKDLTKQKNFFVQP